MLLIQFLDFLKDISGKLAQYFHDTECSLCQLNARQMHSMLKETETLILLTKKIQLTTGKGQITYQKTINLYLTFPP